MNPILTLCDELERLADKATPGPYKAASDWDRYAVLSLSEETRKPHYKRVICTGNQNNTDFHDYMPWSGCEKPDADYFTALDPTTIKRLINASRAGAVLRASLNGMYVPPMDVVRIMATYDKAVEQKP